MSLPADESGGNVQDTCSDPPKFLECLVESGVQSAHQDDFDLQEYIKDKVLIRQHQEYDNLSRSIRDSIYRRKKMVRSFRKLKKQMLQAALRRDLALAVGGVTVPAHVLRSTLHPRLIPALPFTSSNRCRCVQKGRSTLNI